MCLIRISAIFFSIKISYSLTHNIYFLKQQKQKQTWCKSNCTAARLFTLHNRSYTALIKSCPATRHESAWGERRCSSYSFPTSELDACEWSASRPDRALSQGRDPWYPLYRRLGRLQSQSGHRVPFPCRGSNPDRPARSQTLYCLS
jgi:hypothetical protein